MSQRQKLLRKLNSDLVPTDFKWDDLVKLMRWAGFKEECSGGSHYTFEHNSTGFKLHMSKTHPTGLLKRYQVNHAKEALERIGYQGD